MDKQTLIEECIKIARAASQAVMEIYVSDNFETETKEDNSPLTKADKAADQIIEAGLRQISDYPIISEEGNHDAGTAKDFWLVDPLDGTKEFVKKNGEFTVNIGLIENHKPILGVVMAPAKDVLYFGSKTTGAFRQAGAEQPQKISAQFKGDTPVIFASRSHRGEELQSFLDNLGDHKEMYMGSSLKVCLVADGTAALYPRFSPCMLWDTAAAHAVLNAAGGSLKDLDKRELIYEPSKHLKNPFFIAEVTNAPTIRTA